MLHVIACYWLSFPADLSKTVCS